MDPLQYHFPYYYNYRIILQIIKNFYRIHLESKQSKKKRGGSDIWDKMAKVSLICTIIYKQPGLKSDFFKQMSPQLYGSKQLQCRTFSQITFLVVFYVWMHIKLRNFEPSNIIQFQATDLSSLSQVAHRKNECIWYGNSPLPPYSL